MIATLKNRLIRFLYPYGAKRTVLRGHLKGCRYLVQPGMGATLAWGLDNMNLPFLSAKLRPGQVVYDVGANCGQMAMFFSRAVGGSGRVLAFEPVLQNVGMMRQNLELNAMRHVSVFPVALDREPGRHDLLFDPDRHTMGVFSDASIKLQQWSNTLTVDCESIDHLIASGQPAPDVIKIDVEGAAAEVLAGAETLLGQRPPALYIELHALSHDSPELRLVRDLQQRWNYRVEDVTGSLRDEPGIDWGGAVWCEPSAVKKA